ncbi:TetR/AcrR family transcriptional regulator [Sneathiella marina]|uniref:TetR/AcrR family transcriptional regulator n=1 Tax=Sneathiella marina TaxID=2950108 RepID=A0ABY4W4N2_9PROT|nr:TetR/AcrR family transcriptional regulator [Sneathiella marina]USG61073.1 TetR/AcrR family transcriptional regulator [Sneathiella marina]
MVKTKDAPISRKNVDRRKDSNHRIIQAAMELFAENGYQRTTLIQIGRKAGYTGTLVSNRFGSKERLLRAVLALILNRFETSGNIDQPSNNSDTVSIAVELSDFVAAYLEDVALRGTRIRALYVLMGEGMGSLPEITDEIAHVNEVFRGRISSFLESGKERGEFRDSLDILTTAVLIVGLLRGVAMQILVEPKSLALEDLVVATQKSIRSIVTIEAAM